MTGPGMPQTGAKREHLEETSRAHPEYREVLSLFRDLFAFVEGKEDTTGITFSLPARHSAERVTGGLPLVSPESLTVDRDKATVFLAGILGVLRKAGKDSAGLTELERIRLALEESALDLRSLFAACLGRERKPIEDSANAISVTAALLEFVLEVPLRTSLEALAETVDPGTLEGWKEGYCPVCGSRAGMDELVGEEGKRYLSCSTCFFRWPFRRLGCPYCGNQDPESLSYFLAGDGPTRVGVCRKCSRYIKTRDSRKGNADVPLEAEDLATIHLDLLAGKEGFERGK